MANQESLFKKKKKKNRQHLIAKISNVICNVPEQENSKETFGYDEDNAHD
jgi:hypothetical protein